MKSYKDLKAQGAEGIVLRKPGSFYHDAGSFFTLKVDESNVFK